MNKNLPQRLSDPLFSNGDSGAGLSYQRRVQQLAEEDYADDLIDLKQYWQVLLKYRALIMGCAGVMLALGLIYSFTATPLYTAQSTLKIGSYEPVLATGKIEDILQQHSRESGYFDTHVQELSSFSLADQVLRDPRINALVRGSQGSFFQRLFGANPKDEELLSDTGLIEVVSSTQRFSGDGIGRLDYQASYGEIRSYLGLIKVSPVRRTSLANIEVSHKDPKMAAYVANKHATEYINWVRYKRIEQQSRGLAFLRAQANELRQKVSDLERELADYAETHEIIALNADENITVQKMSQLNRQLTEATGKRIRLENEYREAKAALSSNSAGIDDSSVQSMRSALGNLQAERQLLSTKFTSSYPRIVQIDAQIANLNESIQDQRAQIVAGLGVRAQAAAEEEQNLKEELEQQKSLAFELSQRQVDYNVLNRELSASRQLLQNILAQINETSIAVESNTSNVSLVDPAVTPESPSFPRKKLILAGALVLGLFIGVMLALLLNHFDNSVRTLDDLINATRKPALGLIPSFEASVAEETFLLPEAGLEKSGAEAALNAEAAVNSGAINGDLINDAAGLAGQEENGSGEKEPGAKDDKEDKEDKEAKQESSLSLTPAILEIMPHFVKNPQAMASEAYRAIRTALLLSKAEEAPKKILVTSSQASEGKTTTALNLAASFASVGRRILVIDADLRRPRVGRELGVLGEKAGLTEVLTGQSAHKDALLKDLIPNVSLLLSGAVPPNPAELLGSQKMERLLEELGAEFDHIIIDSPPVLPVTDSVVLSRYVDGVTLVVRAGVTPRQAIQDAIEKLQYVGANILGCVLNDVDTSKSEYQYYNRYYAAYYNSAESKARAGNFAA